MIQYVKHLMGIKERSDLASAKIDINTQAEKTEGVKSQVDYIAMMTDIELPLLDTVEGGTHEPEI